jgi:hypothetical protein
MMMNEDRGGVHWKGKAANVVYEGLLKSFWLRVAYAKMALGESCEALQPDVPQWPYLYARMDTCLVSILWLYRHTRDVKRV